MMRPNRLRARHEVLDYSDQQRVTPPPEFTTPNVASHYALTCPYRSYDCCLSATNHSSQ